MIHVCFVGWSADPFDRMLISYSPSSSMIARLPLLDNHRSTIHLVVLICDKLGSAAEVMLPSVPIERDMSPVNSLIQELIDESSTDLNRNPVIQALSSGNQNSVSQLLASISGAMNGMNDENIQQAIESNFVLFFSLHV